MSPTSPPQSFAEEAYRPRLHYTAADTWINDPNGLVYADGMYHLFFQNNPFGTGHANMSWGHAVSRDLIHWEDLPLAIPCDEEEQIFSGSAVVDHGNTSGFGEPGTAPLVAIYTSAYTGRSTHPGIQAQSLAYSLDGGQTWTKHAGNPVLSRDSPDFRDPKVFRYTGPAGDYWVMVAVEAVDRKVVLYRSDDLKSWTYLSEFTSASPVGRIWECPDLFPLPVEEDRSTIKWVLVVNLDRNSGEGGSAGIYFVGDFEGVAFTASGNPSAGAGEQPEWEWLDHGRDYYATVSFNNAPHGRRILVGWMNNWDYARAVPTTPWRGAMALPREATLHTHSGRHVLRQRVVADLERAAPVHALGLRDIPDGTHPLGIAWGEDPCLIEATFAAGSSTEFGLVLRQGDDERTLVGYDVGGGQLIVDRTASGIADFSPLFPSTEAAPVPLVGDRLRLQIYIDAASLEVFAQDGLATVTEQIFPHPSSSGISLYSKAGTAQLVGLTLIPLKDAPVLRTAGSLEVQGAAPSPAGADA